MILVIRGSFAAELPLRQFAAVPIGAVVGIEVMVLGPVAGAAMNPARAFVLIFSLLTGNFFGSTWQGHSLE
jgi:glycerol uptake facilitator-like aquaporin